MDSTMSSCPVCSGKVSAASLPSHLSTHSKDEVVVALLRQKTNPSVVDSSTGIHFLASNATTTTTHNVYKKNSFNINNVVLPPPPPPLPTTVASASSTASTKIVPGSNGGNENNVPIQPILMPPMMGMVQVMSPCLVPQPNGPPLLLNMPSYIYPNMLSSQPTLFGGFPSATTASTSTINMSSSSIPSQGVPTATTVSHETDKELPTKENREGPNNTQEQQQEEEEEEEQGDRSSRNKEESKNLNNDVEKENKDVETGLKTWENGKGTKIKKKDVRTIQTVNDLQNALKTMDDDDFQIVVPHELADTAEFKCFISNFDLPSSEIPGAPPNTPIPKNPTSNNKEEDDEDTRSTVDTTNTMTTTPPSPQPCSSRDISQGGYEDNDLEDEEDDITLQDLVALETMDEDGVDDDQFFALHCNNPLESFMHSSFIQQQQQQQQQQGENNFSCEKCGLHFSSVNEYRIHFDSACRQPRKGGIVKKTSKNKKKKLENTTDWRKNEDQEKEMEKKEEEGGGGGRGEEDENEEVDDEVEDDEILKVKTDSIKKEIQEETSLSSISSTSLSNQPVLAAVDGHHWKCNGCKIVFESGPQLLDHLDTIRRADFKCTSCHEIFDDKKTAVLHKRKFHPSTKANNKLKTLEKNSVKNESLSSSLVPNANGEYICEKCDRAFKDKDMIIKHMTCHDEEKPFECLECGKKFAKSSLLRDHRKRHFEVGNFECVYCQKRFYTPNKLREHVRTHTGEAPLSCNICGKSFRRHSNLSEHKRIHQDNRPVKPPKELFCECGSVFKTQRDLDWHWEAEHEKKPKKCSYCGEIFVHSSSLTRHVRLKHESNFVPTDKKSSLYANCPVCDQMFYKTSINKHIRIKHQGQKPYQCDICKHSFVTKYNLLNHQWQHKGVRSRPFKCTLCQKAYLRQSLLDAHMRSHRGIKPFVCNECGLQFANKSNWQRHVQEHSGTRNYECPHCHKRFSRGYYLTDHLKVHTGEKPYSCNICGKMAATRSNYNSHLRTHITREPINSEV